jgi:hypothetical protein
LEVLQIKYDTNISKLYGVYKHTEENDQVHHIKKKAKEISEFIAELFFEWKGYFVSILHLVSNLCVNASHSVFVLKSMCECFLQVILSLY